MFRRALVLTVPFVIAVTLVLLSCNGPDPRNEHEFNERTVFPEESATLLAVIAETDTLPVSDTVKLIYSPGAAKPDYVPGDVLFGAMSGGYMKKIVSISERGDTLIALTEQATLLDVFDKLRVDTTFPIAPTQLLLPETRAMSGDYGDGEDSQYEFSLTFRTPRIHNPDDRTAIVTVPDFRFEAIDKENQEVVISVKMSALVLTLTTDFSGFVDIREGLLGVPDYRGFEVEFLMHDTLEFRDLELTMLVQLEKEFSQTLCVAYAPFMLGPVPMAFRFAIDAGVILSVAAEASATGQVTAGFNLELWAKHEGGLSLPDGDIDIKFGGEAELTEMTGTFSAEVKPYVSAEASVLLAGVLGPYLRMGPYQYTLLSSPPPTLDIGVGVSAEFGILLDAFGLFEIRGGWEFLDADISLFYTSRIFAENFALCNLGPGVRGGANTWSDSIAPASWLGVVADGYGGTRCLLVHDTTFDRGMTPPDWDLSQADAYVNIPHRYDEVRFLFKTDNADCDIGVRARGDALNLETQSWHVVLYDGSLAYQGPSDIHRVATLSPGRWHSLRLRLNHSSNTYDIYLDGTRVKQSAPYRGSSPGLSYLQIVEYDSSHNATPGLRIDNISLWSNSPGLMALPAPGPVQPEGGLHRGGRRFGR